MGQGTGHRGERPRTGARRAGRQVQGGYRKVGPEASGLIRATAHTRSHADVSTHLFITLPKAYVLIDHYDNSGLLYA